jgi:hypothetical protein
MARLRMMASSPAISAEKLYSRLDREVSAVRRTMALIHGGKWSTDIDHDGCFVAVCRDWR